MFDKKWYEHEKRCFLHLLYHLDNVPSKAIQRFFREHLLKPTAKPCLPNLRNFMGVPIKTNQMIIALDLPPT
jgi:hypothetical protein